MRYKLSYYTGCKIRYYVISAIKNREFFYRGLQCEYLACCVCIYIYIIFYLIVRRLTENLTPTED